VVLHRLEQIGVAKPLFSQKQVDDDLEAANEWPKAHSMTPLYTKQKWQGITDDDLREMLGYDNGGYIPDYKRNFVKAIEAKLKEKNT
jgi:hypothetical protein